ncbi:MAG: bifunctional UDP-N-acetylmuramoyl-tripeptide:D-alanyl-D-alanine ligase/alanine racemase [Cytophagales bacterium]|nr:bifunctional UDP-N-acetylmuramoyl-tripeptide:D-alanyl-D-alanine ligase/alanine racemase [Cytophagales bacterium]
MEFEALSRVVSGKVLQPGTGTFQFVATDSRTIQHPESTLFFAHSGPNHDGHEYLQELYDSGVRSFIVERPVELNFPEVGIILVDESLKALQQLAAYHRQQYQYQVIGVTGSNGKTIVKEWLAMLLETHYQVVKSPKSYNSQLGVPLSIMEMAERHDLAILEAGISMAGEMETLAALIQPDIGIFTNIGPAHDSGFTDRQSKIQEKSLLFSSCKWIICRYEHTAVREKLKSQYADRAISWSLGKQGAELHFKLTGNLLSCNWKGRVNTIRIPFTDGPQLENLLHVLAACLLLEVSLSEVEMAISRLRNIEMRLALKKGANDCYLLDDSYNNDLSGLNVALNILDQQRQKANKTLILSDIQQSGLSDEALYHQVNDLLEKHGVNRLIGVGPRISESQSFFKIHKTFFASTKELINELPAFQNEIVLVKGARNFGLERVVSILEEKHHGTSLTIHFEKVLHNLNAYRNLLSETKLMVMVKAHAYGGGSYELANFLQYHQVDYLGVAYVNEGVDLRKNGLEIPIMVMNPEWESLPMFGTYQLEPEIYSLEMLRYFVSLGITVPIHLKIETGMNRLGFEQAELASLIALLLENKVKVQSIFTHLAAAEDPSEDDFSREQLQIFNAAYEQIVEGLGYEPIKHALNSAGIARWPEFHFDMVRLGIGLYGIDPSETLEVLPVSTFKTQISQIKHLMQGATIGYGRMGIAESDMTIATLPVGYADGYRRSFGRGGVTVLVKDREAPTIGNICMDMTMIDVTGIPAQQGDDVILFGERPHITALAKCADTIPYEILTSISPRVKREYSWD